MSTNLIDEMTEREAKDLLNRICNEFKIGGEARTPSAVMTNVENSTRRDECLSRIEGHFTYQVLDDDGEETEECPLNWGADPDQYIIDFKAATDCA